MAWQALHVRPTGEMATIPAPTVCGSGVDTTISSAVVNAGCAMTCYCSCPLPYDSSYTNWVAVFTTPITGEDCPMHATTLPFPLNLPLYPQRDLVVLAFKGSRASKDAPPSLYLHFPVQQELIITCPISLNVSSWLSAEVAWATAIKSLSTLSWLSYAFDGLWNLQTDKEVYQDADLLDGEEEGGVDAVDVTAVLQPLQKEVVDSSSYDEDMVDDGEEDVDAFTGMVTVRDESVVTSEEEYESENATEEEEEEGEDEKDEGEEL
jgi:hypothetical protein